MSTSLDRAGNPRITGGTVDMGVYVNTNLLESPQAWTLVPPEQTGTATALTLTITNIHPQANYRTGVRRP